MASLFSHDSKGGNSIAEPRNVPTSTERVHSKPWHQMNKLRPSTLPPDNFTIGSIIRAPMHQEDYLDGLTATDLAPPVAEGSFMSHPSNQSREDKDISQWAHGYILTKVRFMIVIAKFDKHYLAIPLYTRKHSFTIVSTHYLTSGYHR